jgi:hypothetical protein
MYIHIMDVPKEIEGLSDALSAWRIYAAYWNPAGLAVREARDHRTPSNARTLPLEGLCTSQPR